MLKIDKIKPKQGDYKNMSSLISNNNAKVTTISSGLNVVENDLTSSQIQFLKDLRNVIKAEKGSQKLQLYPLFVCSNTGVQISKKVQDLIKKSGYSVEQAKEFFGQSMKRHLKHLPSGIEIPENRILLASLSTIEIHPGNAISETPGMAYHQDGLGKVISTEISMIGDPNSWKGGSLHVLDPCLRTNEVAINQVFGKSPKELKATNIVRVSEGSTVLFDNKRLFHAVETPLSAETSTERTIYQIRLNDADKVPQVLLRQYTDST